MSDQEDPWEAVARAALEQSKAMSAANREIVPAAPVCAYCHQPVVVNEHGIVKPHFAKVTDERPCRRSFLPLDPANDPKPKQPPKQPATP